MNLAEGESYTERYIMFGYAIRATLLEYQDDEDIENMVNEHEQVQLLNGNRDLYVMIDNNMRNGDLDKFLIKEHNIIYAWREKFFNHHFPNGSWFTVPDPLPFVPGDGYLRLITIPYQITRYFDRVMALASAKDRALLSWYKQITYFENDGHLASEAECKYKWGELMNDLSEAGDDHEKLTLCDEVNVGFGEVSHIIAEAFITGSKKLEEIALKAIMVNHITSNISSEGKELFKTMKRVFALTL